MTYDFHGGSGWAGVRRLGSLDFSGRLDSLVPGARHRHAEHAGDQVPGRDRRERLVGPPGELLGDAAWQTIAVRKRHVSFAWGPAGGGELRHAAALEIVLSAGTGGRGFFEVEEPVLSATAARVGSPRPAHFEDFRRNRRRFRRPARAVGARRGLAVRGAGALYRRDFVRRTHFHPRPPRRPRRRAARVAPPSRDRSALRPARTAAGRLRRAAASR